jgi:hypothetical protein
MIVESHIVVIAEQVDLDLGRAFDDVVVGEDQAILADDEAGAGGKRNLRPLLLAARRLSAEEALEQLVAAAAATEEVGEFLRPLARLGADVDHGRAHRFRDVPKRGGINGTGERRGVCRRDVDGRLGHRHRREIQTRGQHHADGD